mmetsp:Transcript_40557/g.73303  ORF Transcript_40557/g.73303 Transcript_40557/m.73303 type:complete len:197 (-) Transcript_40557:248-838(-)
MGAVCMAAQAGFDSPTKRDTVATGSRSTAPMKLAEPTLGADHVAAACAKLNEKLPLEGKPSALEPENSIKISHREENLEVMVKKPSASSQLGLDMDGIDGNSRLRVKKIHPGYLIAKMNKKAKEDKRNALMDGDVILSVNGVSGNDREMLNKMRDGRDLSLQILRVTCEAGPTPATTAPASPASSRSTANRIPSGM